VVSYGAVRAAVLTCAIVLAAAVALTAFFMEHQCLRSGTAVAGKASLAVMSGSALSLLSIMLAYLVMAPPNGIRDPPILFTTAMILSMTFIFAVSSRELLAEVGAEPPVGVDAIAYLATASVAALLAYAVLDLVQSITRGKGRAGG